MLIAITILAIIWLLIELKVRSIRNVPEEGVPAIDLDAITDEELNLSTGTNKRGSAWYRDKVENKFISGDKHKELRTARLKELEEGFVVLQKEYHGKASELKEMSVNKLRRTGIFLTSAIIVISIGIYFI